VPFELPAPKPCHFVGASRRELQALPDDVRGEIGHALYEAQCGREPTAAKALKGFGGRGVLEVVEDFDGNTYRAVYTVRFAGLVYVLRAFQKKSKSGIATPKAEIELIKARLRAAEADYRARVRTGGHRP
jgi:phage-related protein